MKFKNPQNGYIEKSSSPFSWLWCFLFGALYFVAKGNWIHAAIYAVASIATYGVALLIYPFFVYKVNNDFYRRKGWIQVD